MKMKLSVPGAVDQWFNNLAKRPVLAVTMSILWIILIAGVAFGWHLGNIGLIDETEPLFAEASRQMLVTGDWITPFFNGETRFDKPALIYWCQAIAYAIMGVNEWAVRLPSVLAAIAVMGLVFYTLQQSLKREDELEQASRPTRRYLIAAVAAAMTALNPEMIAWGRIGVSDMLLTGCMASALLCFFLGYANQQQSGVKSQESRVKSYSPSSPQSPFPIPRSLSVAEVQSPFPNKWYLAFYVLIAAGILTKGPVGIVLPGLIIAGFVLYLGKVREVWREMRPLLGLLIVVVLAVPWYALVIWRNGWNFINAFFGYHNLERFTEVVNGHSAPWYFYFVVVTLGFTPYSVYLPGAIARLKFWQRQHWLEQERSQQLGLFAGFWFIGVFGFFTVAVTKLPSYVLPLMPAAAILVALLWSDQLKGTKSPSHKIFVWSGWANVAFLSALAVALFNLYQISGSDPAAPDIFLMIEQSGVPALGGMIWLVCAVIIAALLISRRWNFLISVNLLGFVAFFVVTLMPTLFLLDEQRQLPLRELSAIAVPAQQPNEEFIMIGFKKPSVAFYTRRHVNYLQSAKEAVDHIQNQKNKEVKPPSLLAIAERSMFVKMGLQPDDYKYLATKGAYSLIRVPLKKAKKPKLDISYQVR
ncbi:glycosyltransferase family 39 protein [Calothrix sp. PCC 7507]|uniref:ArnT family glycosyltransferase n=1 Tax=Calothrix sp. PCC 7507 TaxID=99598 RepID=UPI00029F14C7|nr:glycosyltransferase family 39 protein [Calothrix sp. PCC 7507]AFY35522.1 glycosyl transferase family 39 [Calothrix sp. PCC 7507]